MSTAREPGRIGPLVLELLPPPERTPAGREALHEVRAAGGALSELASPLLGRLRPPPLLRGPRSRPPWPSSRPAGT
ncbi:hypothetical protein OG365_15590 [Streptomyces sp. NBC_00853]|uniref:hypothetical protein n=1 Tax=Streptomyces sp. NBC_00853 TaxID=2903681 RepID=UPI003873494C|nr:hypothetical protein OG365_15590 [Streptomyces sp. NBC_00853]